MEINVERLIEHKLNIEGYFILDCLYNEKSDLLDRYCKTIKNKIPTTVFQQLVDEGYLEHDGSKNPDGTFRFALTNISLTDKFKLEVLKVKDVVGNLKFDDAFQQLREHYPTKTPSGRRLHQDLERCKKLYKSAIAPSGIVNAEKHQLILQCVNFMVREKSKKIDDLNYIQALATYLQQKNWETVQEDVEKVITNSGYIEKKSSFGGSDEGGNKTQLGNTDF